MFDYLFEISDAYLFAILCGSSVALTVVCIILIKHFIPLELRYRENGVIGNISAVIGIIYAVLVGLTALYLTNNINFTADAVQSEADGAAGIYRSSAWLNDPTKTQIQKLLKSYAKEVVNVEWPMMEQGRVISKLGDRIIDSIDKELSTYKMTGEKDSVIMRSLLDSIKQMYDGRQHRIQMSYSELNPEVWEVILIGTILTIVINYLFGMHLLMHIVTASAGALMASAMLFLLLSLDRPFQGDFVVQPDSLKSLLADMDNKPVLPDPNPNIS